MKRTGLVISIIVSLFSAIILLGCADAAVETAISDFKSAVNANSPSALKNALSPESTMYITGEWVDLLDTYFSTNIPISYSNYTINVNGADADARVGATYKDRILEDGAWFWFKRENTFLAFLFPSYKVYRYYDSDNGFTDPDAIWRKIQEIKDLEAQEQ